MKHLDVVPKRIETNSTLGDEAMNISNKAVREANDVKVGTGAFLVD